MKICIAFKCHNVSHCAQPRPCAVCGLHKKLMRREDLKWFLPFQHTQWNENHLYPRAIIPWCWQQSLQQAAVPKTSWWWERLKWIPSTQVRIQIDYKRPWKEQRQWSTSIIISRLRHALTWHKRILRLLTKVKMLHSLFLISKTYSMPSVSSTNWKWLYTVLLHLFFFFVISIHKKPWMGRP